MQLNGDDYQFFSCFFMFLELRIIFLKLGKNILFAIGNTIEYRSSKQAKKHPDITSTRYLFNFDIYVPETYIIVVDKLFS